MRAKELFLVILSIFSNKQKIRLWSLMVDDVMGSPSTKDFEDKMSFALRTKIPLRQLVKEFFDPSYILFLIVWTCLLYFYGIFLIFAVWSFFVIIAFIIYNRMTNLQSQTLTVLHFVKKHLDRMHEKGYEE